MATHLEVTRNAVNAAAFSRHVNVCVSLNVNACVWLGLDHGEVLSHDRFVLALAENLAGLIIDSDGGVIDASYVASTEKG